VHCCTAALLAGKPGSVAAGGQKFDIQATMVEIKREKKKLAGRSFIPSVIEPSFGIGRIIYCVFEHSYYTREVSVFNSGSALKAPAEHFLCSAA